MGAGNSINFEYLTITLKTLSFIMFTFSFPPFPLFPLFPHPRWQHGKVKEDGAVLLVEGQCLQLGYGVQWGKGLIDRDSQAS